jgi:hypothetical protein
VTNCQNANLILGYHKSIQSDVPGMSVGNYHLTHLSFDAPANQRMCCKVINRRSDRRHLWPKHGDMLRGSISPCSPAPLGDGCTANPLLDICSANYFLADTHALMIAK